MMACISECVQTRCELPSNVRSAARLVFDEDNADDQGSNTVCMNVCDAHGAACTYVRETDVTTQISIHGQVESYQAAVVVDRGTVVITFPKAWTSNIATMNVLSLDATINVRVSVCGVELYVNSLCAWIEPAKRLVVDCYACSMAVSRTGRYIALVYISGQYGVAHVCVFDAAEETPVLMNRGNEMLYPGDGARLMFAQDADACFTDTDTLLITSCGSGQVRHQSLENTSCGILGDMMSPTHIVSRDDMVVVATSSGCEIWSLDTGKKVDVIGMHDAVGSIAFVDARTLVVAFHAAYALERTRTIAMYDVYSKTCVWSNNLKTDVSANPKCSGIACVNGTVFACENNAGGGRISVFAATGERMHKAALSMCAFNSLRKMVVINNSQFFFLERDKNGIMSRVSMFV